MRHLWLAVPLMLAAVAPVTLSAPAAVAAAKAASFVGTYTLAPAKSDNVDKAIEATVAQLNFILRPIAHSRLSSTNQPYKQLKIYTGEQISVQTDQRAPIVSPASGTPVRWKREDGEVFNVSTRLKGDELVQTFSAEDGKRVNRYVLGPDGQTLTMHVTVTSGKLPKPLTYKLVYYRAR